MKGRSKTMGATLDTGQFASCGHNPAEAARKLAPHLKMVHLKDIEAPGAEVNVLLGRGIARIPEVVAELIRHRLRRAGGDRVLKEGPVEEDLRQEVEYVRKLV